MADGLNNVTFNGTLSYDQVQSLKNQFSVDVNLTVVDEIDEPHGKYPKALGNVAILEQSLVNELLIDAMTYVLKLVDNETIWNTTWAQNLPFEQRQLLKFALPFAKQYTYILREFRDNFKLTVSDPRTRATSITANLVIELCFGHHRHVSRPFCRVHEDGARTQR